MPRQLVLYSPEQNDSDGFAAALADYLSRLDQGDNVRRESFLNEHPEHRAALQEYFADVDFIERVATGSANWLSDDVAELPSRFGDYDLLREIGRGGMGIVYEARERAAGRCVALKMLLHGRFMSSSESDRFQNEARTTANFSHPNLVPILHVGEYQRQLYYTMPLMPGISLAERMAEGPIDPETAARLMLQVADAVAYAHGREVVHRDLKPANILLDEHDKPYVADFGLARQFGEASLSLTVSGDLLGTPNYMAPEQVNGCQEIGPAADIYALGAMLYALLVGRPPFRSESLSETLHNIAANDPVRPRQLDRRVPRDLETICLKCLEKLPAGRYASADALGDDLRRFLAGMPLLAQRVSHMERCRRWFVRNPVIGTLAVCILLTIVGGAGFSLSYASQAHRSEQLAVANLYAADMNLAQQQVRAGAIANAIRLLERHRPVDGAADPRGWEWYHLWHVCHSELRRFEGPQSAVYATAFSPDGRTVAAGGADRTIYLWDTATGRIKHKLNGHSGTIRGLAFSPDGAQLVTVDDSGATFVWNTAAITTGSPPVATILQPPTVGPPDATNGNNTSLTDVSFSRPDGLLIATSGDAAQVRLWDARTCTLVQSIDLGPAQCLAFAPHGAQLAIANGDGCVRICEPDENRIWNLAKTIRAHSGIVHTLKWSPDGSRLATGSEDRFVRIWNVDSWNELDAVGPFSEHPHALAFSPDGNRLAVAVRSEPLRVWDFKQQEFVAELLGHTALTTAATFCPDGWRLLSASEDGTVRLWDAAQTGDHVRLEGHLGHVGSVEFSPDGSLLASGGAGDGAIILWHPQTGEPTGVLRASSDCFTDVAFSRDGKYLATTRGYADAVLRFWDIEARTEKSNVAYAGRIHGVDWSPTNDQVAVLTSEGAIHVTSLANDQHSRCWLTPHGESGPVKFGPGGDKLLTVGGDSIARVWDIATQSLVHELRGHSARVVNAVFNPKGTVIATSSEDYTIRLWDAPTGRCLRVLTGHAGTPKGLAFSPDGKRLASSGTDKKVKIWHVETGLELQSLSGNDYWARDVAFSSDGEQLATAGYDGTVRIWHAPNEATDLSAAREAASLVRHLAQRFRSREQIVNRLQHDRTICDVVRNAALDQSRNVLFYWQPMLEGHRAAQRKDWDATIRYFQRVTALAPNESVHWYWLAMASAAAGQNESYQRACDELLRRCVADPSAANLSWTLRPWLMVSRRVDEVAPLESLIIANSDYLATDPEIRWLCELRAGRTPIEFVDPQRLSHSLSPRPEILEDSYVPALVWLKLGDRDRALTAYQTAERRDRLGTYFWNWSGTVFSEALRREVDELLAPWKVDTSSTATADAASVSGSPAAGDAQESAPSN